MVGRRGGWVGEEGRGGGGGKGGDGDKGRGRRKYVVWSFGALESRGRRRRTPAVYSAQKDSRRKHPIS